MQYMEISGACLFKIIPVLIPFISIISVCLSGCLVESF